jgi:hypothetical protein
MTRAIREHVVVREGGTIEVHHPDLSAGTEAELIILVEQPKTEPPPLTSLIGKAKGCFASAEEVDSFLRAERDAWER